MKHFLVSIFLLLTGASMAQGKLEKAKEKLSSSPEASTGTEIFRSSSSQGSSSSSYRGTFGDYLLASLLFDLTVGIAYNAFFETGYERYGRMSQSALSPYRYYKGKGDYTYDKSSPEDFSLFRTQLTEELFVGQRLYQNHLEGKIRFAKRLGATLSYRHFWETQRGTPTEQLDFLSLTAQYYRVRTQRVSIGWGLGAGYIGNEINQFGISLTSEGEVFVYRPFSLAYGLQYTSFSYADYFTFAGGINYYYKRYHGGLKYQYHNIAGEKFSGMTLSLGVDF